MAITAIVPGMKSGSTGRNIVVGILYLLFFPLVLVLSPLFIAYIVGRDRGGVTTRLSKIPGISEGGGAVSGIAAFCYILVLFAVIGAATGGGNPEPSSSSSEAVLATTTVEDQTTEATTTTTRSTTTTTESTTQSERTVQVRIIYDGEWSGAVSVTTAEQSSSKSISGTGEKTITLDRDASIVSVNAQKQDASSQKLTVQILVNGEVVAESSTTSEYGVASVSKDVSQGIF